MTELTALGNILLSSKDRAKRLAASKKWRDANRDKIAIASAEYAKKHPDRARASALRHYYKHKQRIFAKRFGVTVELLDSLPKSCEICESTIKLCVDHCHASDTVRGTLCDSCNRAIGFMKEDCSRLLAAVEYLKKHEHLKKEVIVDEGS